MIKSNKKNNIKTSSKHNIRIKRTKRSKKIFVQRGGTLLTDIQKLCDDNALPNVKALMGKMDAGKPSKVQNPFTYDYKPSSTWKESMLESPDSVYEWYTSKNPNFLPIVKQDRTELSKIEAKPKTEWFTLLDTSPYPEITVPEYDFLIMGMMKDLLLIHFTNSMPKISHQVESPKNNNSNNQRSHKLLESPLPQETITQLKAISLIVLKKFDDLVTNGYKYVDFIDYLSDYLLFFSIGDLTPESQEVKKAIDLLKSLKNTCFLVLPTFEQVNYKKVLNLCAAPVLNFRLGNSRVFIHDSDSMLTFEISHDIEFHCKETHDILNFIPGKRITAYRRPGRDTFVYNPTEVRKIFERKLSVFHILHPLYNYDIKKVNAENDDNAEDKKKYLLACLLFYLMHEEGISSDGHFNFTYVFLIKQFNNFIDKIQKNNINYDFLLESFMYNGKPQFIKSVTIADLPFLDLNDENIIVVI
jgi:hypothetical protein